MRGRAVLRLCDGNVAMRNCLAAAFQPQPGGGLSLVDAVVGRQQCPHQIGSRRCRLAGGGAAGQSPPRYRARNVVIAVAGHYPPGQADFILRQA